MSWKTRKYSIKNFHILYFLLPMFFPCSFCSSISIDCAIYLIFLSSSSLAFCLDSDNFSFQRKNVKGGKLILNDIFFETFQSFFPQKEKFVKFVPQMTIYFLSNFSLTCWKILARRYFFQQILLNSKLRVISTISYFLDQLYLS